ncbi:hypothetical protein B0O80DRAFT_428831 [Mortierella sp. GBAus27b]|nr:hypothetical protein BGX31_006346 [Mortierella sp. GBA43]KAI8349805.1 hypothetical protein B0O80DRAFT_428831 [Mortierella sp. GBAus27b]
MKGIEITIFLPFRYVEKNENTEDIRDPPPPWTPSGIHKPLPKHPPPEIPTYNILFLGPTQSGKSTFIEFVKQYVDPEYVPNDERIGYGNESHTQNVNMEAVTTTLPIYRLFDTVEGCEVSVSRALSSQTDNDYRSLLRRHIDLELLPDERPGSQACHFRLFDTPGLDDTKGNDIQNIARTFSALSMVDEFHLVVITDSHHVPLSVSQKTAFRTYFELFRELKTLITVVHTKVQYLYRHPANTRFEAKLTARSQYFNELMGRTVPTKRIDCDLDERGLVQTCLTRNTIREILEMARVKVPVVRNKAVVQKTPMMRTVDRIVYDKYKAKLESVEQSCEALGEADKLDIKIADTKCEIKNKEETLSEYDTDDLVQLFEKRFDEEVGFAGWFQDLFGRANTTHTMEYSNHDCIIDKKNLISGAIVDITETGGEGHSFWKAEFRRNTFRTGYLHVVLSMTRRTQHRKVIEELRREIEGLNQSLEEDSKELERLNGIVKQNVDSRTSSEVLERLKDKKSKYKMVIAHAYAFRLSLNEFLELADAGIYDGSSIDVISNANALESHLKNKFGIDVQ